MPRVNCSALVMAKPRPAMMEGMNVPNIVATA